jgi:choline-sulfatase
MNKPNILFLMSDQHTSRLMGCAGAGFVRTPVMDRLAANGVRFANAYCAHPHCVPSRASLMTGQQTFKIPCYDNGSTFRSDLPTWAHMLRHAGYHTVLNGKMHFVGEDYHHGFHEHVNEPRCQIGGFRWGEERPDPTTGKRYWADLHFEGDPVFEKRMRDEGARVTAAVDFLKKGQQEKPWCHVVGFAGPHYPQCCTRELYDSYAGVAIPEPLGPEALHPRHQHWRRCWGFDRLTPEQDRDARRAYLAMITQVDLWMGEILDALEQSGQADNTVVIYTADHGEMWAEHGLWGKQVFFEESAAVSLIVSAPALGVRSGAVVDTPVSLLDLYPTLRELADAGPWTVPLDGRSLAPALRGGSPLPDAPVFCEYDGPDTKGPERMVRFGPHKLNYYHHQGLELFDLSEDSREVRNLADDPRFKDVRDRLLAVLTDGWSPEDVDRLVREDQNRRSLVTLCYPGEVKAL